MPCFKQNRIQYPDAICYFSFSGNSSFFLDLFSSHFSSSGCDFAVFSIWFNIDNRSNVRCNYEWEDSRSHGTERRMFYYHSFNTLRADHTKFNTQDFSCSSIFSYIVDILIMQTMGFSEVFCLIGWLAILFAKVIFSL